MTNICFLGDISFNDKGKNHNLDISQFLNLNSDSNFTVANLEALANCGDTNFLKKPRVTTSIDSLSKLKDLGINLVTLAHNHIYDAKTSGFQATLKKLDELEISYIGAGLSLEEAEKPFIINLNKVKVGMLNYCHQDTNPSLPENCDVYINKYDRSKIEKDIFNLCEICDHVVLLLHWGGSFEGGYYPDRYQLEDSKRFSEAGASIIIGHHPHTLQPFLKYHSTSVYFSLGNFIFYDVKHEEQNIKLSPRRKRGGILKVSIDSTFDNRLYYSKQNDGHIQVSKANIYHTLRSKWFRAFKELNVFYVTYNFIFKYINPLFYFVFIQEGGLKKYKKLNLNKVKKFIWKK